MTHYTLSVECIHTGKITNERIFSINQLSISAASLYREVAEKDNHEILIYYYHIECMENLSAMEQH